MPNFLGIIPVRKGSKEIKNKNYLKINGKSLIKIAYENAQKSKFLDKIIISTDDSRVLKEFRSTGNVPFKRPKYLATDKSSTLDVAKHAVRWLEINQKWFVDYIVILQVTTPFRSSKLIDKCIKTINKKKLSSLITIKKTDYPSMWTFFLNKKNNLSKCIKTKKNYKTRQETKQSYQPCGNIFILKKEILFKKNLKFPLSNTYAYLCNEKLNINIDNILQYKFAKFLSNLKNV